MRFDPVRTDTEAPVRVAQIVGNARLGGVVSCLMNYYRHIDKSKYRFDFITYGPSQFDESVCRIDGNSRIYYIAPFDGASFLKAIFQLKDILKKGRYAIAHSHLTTLSAFSLRAAKSAGVPIRICHAHSTFDRQSDHYFAKAVLRPFAAKCATHRMACGKLAAENLYGKRAEEAFILPNAIDLNKFSPQGPAAQKTGYTALFVGRFVPQKNLFFLLDAFALAVKIRPMTLVMLGDGAQRETLEKYAKELGINGYIRWVPPCDPAPWYRAADVFVLPSLYEGLPVVGIEAQASGLPCLFSDKVSLEASVCDKNKFLPLDKEIWAKEMALPREKQPDNNAILRAAHFDIETEAHRLTDFYDNALADFLKTQGCTSNSR